MRAPSKILVTPFNNAPATAITNIFKTVNPMEVPNEWPRISII